MESQFLEHMTTRELINGFNSDLALIVKRGTGINKALNKLTTLGNVPEAVREHYQSRFQSLKREDKELREAVDNIFKVSQDPRLQVQLLIPQLQKVKARAKNLYDEIRSEARERILEARQMQEPPVQEPPVQEPPVQEPPVQETPVQESPVQETPVQETPVQETPVQQTPVQETPVQETHNLVLPENTINNYSFPILQITVPIKLKPTQKLQPQNQLISRFLSNTSFEFQLKCVKSQNNQSNIFFGITMNINPDFLNSASTKSTFITLQIYNKSASFSRYHENDKSYVTAQLGQIFRIKNTDINISTNFGCKNMTFKKESFSFQIQAKADLYTIVSSKSKSRCFCKPQLTVSYEFFPFEKNLIKTTQINKKQNTLIHPTITQNLNVISNSKINSIKGKEFPVERNAADMIEKSNLLRAESHIFASTSPLPLIIKPSQNHRQDKAISCKRNWKDGIISRNMAEKRLTELNYETSFLETGKLVDLKTGEVVGVVETGNIFSEIQPTKKPSFGTISLSNTTLRDKEILNKKPSEWAQVAEVSSQPYLSNADSNGNHSGALIVITALGFLGGCGLYLIAIKNIRNWGWYRKNFTERQFTLENYEKRLNTIETQQLEIIDTQNKILALLEKN